MAIFLNLSCTIENNIDCFRFYDVTCGLKNSELKQDYTCIFVKFVIVHILRRVIVYY